MEEEENTGEGQDTASYSQSYLPVFSEGTLTVNDRSRDDSGKSMVTFRPERNYPGGRPRKTYTLSGTVTYVTEI